MLVIDIKMLYIWQFTTALYFMDDKLTISCFVFSGAPLIGFACFLHAHDNNNKRIIIHTGSPLFGLITWVCILYYMAKDIREPLYFMKVPIIAFIRKSLRTKISWWLIVCTSKTAKFMHLKKFPVHGILMCNNNTHIHIALHIRTYLCKYVHVCTYAHACTQTHTHTCMHTQTHKHTHTNT